MTPRVMVLNEYHFVTRWRVKALREEVFAVLTDSESLTRWWPSVYRSVQPITSPTGPGGVGKRLLLDTQGWLPYRLRWELRVVEQPTAFATGPRGDGGLRGERCVDAHAGRQRDRGEVRVGDPRPKAAVEASLFPSEARVHAQPSLGDGARPRESRARARTQAGQAGRTAARAGERAVVEPSAHGCLCGARSGASRSHRHGGIR